MKQRIETLQKKFKKDQESVEASIKERQHEIVVKAELRKMREGDIKQINERIKRKDTMRKLYILEKEFGYAESIEQAKFEKEKLA